MADFSAWAGPRHQHYNNKIFLVGICVPKGQLHVNKQGPHTALLSVHHRAGLTGSQCNLIMYLAPLPTSIIALSFVFVEV